jgi:hypothetical protein
MRTVLRWVHLSDIHFKWSDKLDQESGLRQIEKDIETKKKSGWVLIGFIFGMFLPIKNMIEDLGGNNEYPN